MCPTRCGTIGACCGVQPQAPSLVPPSFFPSPYGGYPPFLVPPGWPMAHPQQPQPTAHYQHPKKKKWHHKKNMPYAPGQAHYKQRQSLKKEEEKEEKPVDTTKAVAPRLGLPPPPPPPPPRSSSLPVPSVSALQKAAQEAQEAFEKAKNFIEEQQEEKLQKLKLAIYMVSLGQGCSEDEAQLASAAAVAALLPERTIDE